MLGGGGSSIFIAMMAARPTVYLLDPGLSRYIYSGEHCIIQCRTLQYHIIAMQDSEHYERGGEVMMCNALH